MDDLWSFTKDGLKAGANATTILKFCGAGGAAVAVMGAFPIPRVGAGRAVGLFFRSMFFGARQKPRTWSQRQNEVAALQRTVSRMKPGEYVAITGGKGVGKTSLIQTALRGWGGVICVTISPGMKQDDIVTK
jgi:ABC-type multidrug transport system fused ATPase/permease subunit